MIDDITGKLSIKITKNSSIFMFLHFPLSHINNFTADCDVTTYNKHAWHVTIV